MATYVIKIGRKYVSDDAYGYETRTDDQYEAIRISIPRVVKKTSREVIKPRLVKLTKRSS